MFASTAETRAVHMSAHMSRIHASTRVSAHATTHNASAHVIAHQGATLIWRAFCNDRLETVKALIDADADVDITSDFVALSLARQSLYRSPGCCVGDAHEFVLEQFCELTAVWPVRLLPMLLRAGGVRIDRRDESGINMSRRISAQMSAHM